MTTFLVDETIITSRVIRSATVKESWLTSEDFFKELRAEPFCTLRVPANLWDICVRELLREFGQNLIRSQRYYLQRSPQDNASLVFSSGRRINLERLA